MTTPAAPWLTSPRDAYTLTREVLTFDGIVCLAVLTDTAGDRHLLVATADDADATDYLLAHVTPDVARTVTSAPLSSGKLREAILTSPDIRRVRRATSTTATEVGVDAADLREDELPIPN